MDRDGIWTQDLVELFLPVAAEIEASRAAVAFNAVASATSGLFDKGKSHRSFLNRLRKVFDETRIEHLRQRGIEPEGGEEAMTGAGWVFSLARRLGIEVPGKTPPPSPKKSPGRAGGVPKGPTKVHKG